MLNKLTMGGDDILGFLREGQADMQMIPVITVQPRVMGPGMAKEGVHGGRTRRCGHLG